MRLIKVCIMFTSLLSLSQTNINKDNDLFFESILTHQKKFNYDIQKAYVSQNFKKVEIIFNSFIETHLLQTKMNDFSWNRFKSKAKSLNDIEDLPIYLLTRSSWCIPSEGEVPAINQIAAKYKDKIKFVVLFWDPKSKMKQQGRKYNRIVEVVYIDELKNKNDYTIKALKHVLGVPTVYVLDENKKVRLVERFISTPFHYESQKSMDMCKDEILKQLEVVFKQ